MWTLVPIRSISKAQCHNLRLFVRRFILLCLFVRQDVETYAYF